MAAFTTQAQLEVALGGPAVLVQLADYDQDGAADATVVTTYLDIGAGRVRAALEVKHEPEAIAALDAESLRLVQAWNADLSAEVAWEMGGQGQVVPRPVADRAARARADLDRVAAGTLRLGRASGGKTAGINQPAAVFDHDKLRQGWSTAAFKQAGFR